MNRGGIVSFGGRESAVGRETAPGSPADSKTICVFEEGASKLEKIVILTERPQENDSLISYLRSLFPDCEIRMVSRPVALIGEGSVDPWHVAAGNGKKKE